MQKRVVRIAQLILFLWPHLMYRVSLCSPNWLTGLELTSTGIKGIHRTQLKECGAMIAIMTKHLTGGDPHL